MGQKINPKGFRIGIIEDWESFWFASDSDYATKLKEDLELRKYLKQHLYKAGISRIKIRRKANQIEVDITTAKPGLIIGKGGKEISAIRQSLLERTGKQIQINVHEEPKPEACAVLVAESIASQLERRIAFRRAMKQAVSKVLRSGGKGVKIMCGGRLGGSEIARRERYKAGSVPLQTLRANVEYGVAEAMTMYGKIGIKVWIYKGDVLKEKQKGSPIQEAKEQAKAAEKAGTEVKSYSGTDTSKN